MLVVNTTKSKFDHMIKTALLCVLRVVEIKRLKKNISLFYTTMIQNLREEWLILFAESKNSISIVNPPVTVICDDKFIMDYIFLVSNHGPTFLHYLSCISQVFIKYRLSFKFSKCDFFKPRVDFLGMIHPL